MLPTEVLSEARDELLSFNRTGMSVMELSHRSKQFAPVLERAESGLRELLGVPDNYRVLFLQGGASMQFAMVPMNFLRDAPCADYVVTGTWGKKAVDEARRAGQVNIAYTSENSGFKSIPTHDELHFSENAGYVHYTSNETVDGVEFKYDLDAGGIPVICDASSNILSRPIHIEKYALIYAGAQKNIGPSGVTVAIIREEMLERVPKDQFSMFDYKKIAENRSMFNTPNTWGIYLVGLVCEWLKAKGGLSTMAATNAEKAEILYDAIDSSDGFYTGLADRGARSHMNVTFRLPTETLEEEFCGEAESQGMYGLKGHRTVGGIRASIYNAFPKSGVETLVEFMNDFAGRKG